MFTGMIISKFRKCHKCEHKVYEIEDQCGEKTKAAIQVINFLSI